MIRSNLMFFALLLGAGALAAEPVQMDAAAVHSAAEQVWAQAPELAQSAADLPVLTTRAGGTRLGAGSADPRVAPVHLDLALHGDLDADVRAAHARAGASLLGQDVSLATPLLDSPDPHLRAAVLVGLERNGSSEVGRLLADAAVDRDAHVREVAVALLGKRQDAPQHAGALVRASVDPSPQIRRLAVRAMGWHRLTAQQSVVQARLTDGDATVRFAALRALERLDRDAAVSAAKGMLDDTDANVRRAAEGLR